MADDLKTVVQRMIDAGESEENIGTVIQHFKAQPPFNVEHSRQTLAAANQRPLPPTPTVGDEFTMGKMGDRALSGLKGEAEGFAGSLAAPVAAVGYGIMHPVDAAKAAGEGAMGLGALAVNAVTHPARTYGLVKDAAMRTAADPERIGQVAGGIDAALATPAILKAAKGTRLGGAVAAGVSDAANKIPGVRAARDAWAASAPASEAAPPVGAAAPPSAPAPDVMTIHGSPVQIGQGTRDLMQQRGMVPVGASPVEAPIQAPHPLTAPRVDVGAEVVGRQSGMTKQAVRDVTGPILGEAPGEASPVFPEKPLHRMIDTMKALPKTGAERTAYVQAARDPKTMAQLENLRRTLAHLGLVGTAAVGTREALLNGMQGDQ